MDTKFWNNLLSTLSG